MTDELKTRHLVVTLHDAWPEEADSVAESIGHRLARWGIEGSAEHALGETLPDGITARVVSDCVLVNQMPSDESVLLVGPDEVRALAGALLKAASQMLDSEVD